MLRTSTPQNHFRMLSSPPWTLSRPDDAREREIPNNFSGGPVPPLVLSRSCLIARPGGAGGTGGPRKTFREVPVPPSSCREAALSRDRGVRGEREGPERLFGRGPFPLLPHAPKVSAPAGSGLPSAFERMLQCIV